MVRLVHDAPFPPLKAPRVSGLDAWAWRRGRRFGTMVCDRERHQVIDLLPVRAAPSVAQWLQAHPSVEVVCRDRSRLYAEGIRQGAPQAIQVVDRFHLVQHLGEALERFFLRYRRRPQTPSVRHSITLESQHPPGPCSARRVIRDGRSCTTRFSSYMPSTWRLPLLHDVSGQSPDRLPVSRHAPAARAAAVTPSRKRLVAPSTQYLRRRWNDASATPKSSGGSSCAQGHSRRGGR